MTVATVTAAPDWSADINRMGDGTFSVFSDEACIASDVHEIADAVRIASRFVAGSGPGEHAVVTYRETEALLAALDAAPRKG